MLLYHSTSLKNARLIEKSGFIESYTYFSDKLEISQRYGSFYGNRYATFVVETNLYSKDTFVKGNYFQNRIRISHFSRIK